MKMDTTERFHLALGEYRWLQPGVRETSVFEDLRISKDGDATYSFDCTSNMPQLFVGTLEPFLFDQLKGILPPIIFSPELSKICETQYICESTQRAIVLAIAKEDKNGEVAKVLLQWDLVHCGSKIHRDLLACMNDVISFFFSVQDWLNANGIKPQAVQDIDFLNHIGKLA